MLVLRTKPPPTTVCCPPVYACTYSWPGSPQLVSRHLLDAFEELVLRGHFRVDARLPPSVWVLPGETVRIARSSRSGIVRQRCSSKSCCCLHSRAVDCRYVFMLIVLRSPYYNLSAFCSGMTLDFDLSLYITLWMEM